MSLHAFKYFVSVLDSLKFSSLSVCSGLGPYGPVLHFNRFKINNTKFIISIRFTNKPNQVVRIFVSKP